MRTPSTRSIRLLRQTDEMWQVVITQLKMWITPPDEPPQRPWAIFVFVLDSGAITGTELVPATPTIDEVRTALFKAMRQPPENAGPARRPRSIGLADQALIDGLAASFAEIDVQLIDQQPPAECYEIIKMFEEHMNGREEHPGLLSVPDVTPELIGGLFAAAAEFYRAAPWVPLTNTHVIALRHPAERDYRYCSVMGNGGVEYGLALYLTWPDVEHMFNAGDDPMDALPDNGAHSLFFDNITRVPFDDLDAIQQYGWEVVNEQAYPIPIVIDKHEERALRPDGMELRWYEAALRAIPIFVRDHLKLDGLGDYQPIETSIEAPTHAGPIKVDVKYPAGELRLDLRPAQEPDWDDFYDDEETEDAGEAMPFFDRRGMEGMMLKAIAEQFGEQPGIGDPQLDKAQAIMYKAWEETNPGKRITLAHQALATSPNCADAYVLLAEEEADTVGRALEYYRLGAEAGQRALGEAYFKEEVGHFWGVLETRPYLRAMEGMANTLWRLKRRAEAAETYFEMLRLNESDNQGVRYSLADLLLEMDRIDDLRPLLEKYEDDYSSVWTYTRALVEFHAGGASAKANQALKAALKQNKFVPDYLTGKKRIPNRRPDYIGVGDEREAVSYAAAHLAHWRRVPGAIDWLTQQLGAPSPRTKKPSATSKRQRG